MKRRGAIWLVLFLACCLSASALDPSLDINQYAHKSWTVPEGFFKGAISAIAQTPDGYLWLGTEFGIVRFDGVRFVPWQPPANEHLPSSYIRSLLTARDGRLWIGTQPGLASWKNGKLTKYPELARYVVGTLLEDREGTIWAGTSLNPTERLCAIHDGRARCYGAHDSFGQSVDALLEDGGVNLWVGAADGLWRWRPGPPKRDPTSSPVRSLIEGDNGAVLIATDRWIEQLADGAVKPYPLPRGRPAFTPRNLLRDRSGGLWVGTADRGLYHVHGGRMDGFAQSDGLSGDYVRSLFEDREGNVWVATLDGLDRFREFAVPTISVKQGLSNATVFSVLAAADGSVWLGTISGLNRWKDGQVTIYREQNGLPDDVAESLLQDERGRIWVFTARGVAYFANGRFIRVRGLPAGHVRSVAGNTEGNLWMGYQERGLFHLTGEGAVEVERIPWATLGHEDWTLALFPDPVQDGVWLGFRDGGLAYFKDGKIRASYSTANGLGEGRVESLQLDRDGALWAATQGGLSRVKNDRVATLTSRNGLPCDSVRWLAQDEDGSFWLYTACGLVRIVQTELEAWVTNSKRTVQVTVFDGADGVRSRAISRYGASVAKSKDGKLWFVAYDGVSVIDPRHLAFNKLPPPVHIEQITADRKTHDATSHLHLPPLVGELEIDYTALSFVVPEKVRFRYKLEGFDRDWQDAGNRRQAFYTNLSPRNYRFRVIASNNSGIWNEQGDTLDFSVAPAYYQTKWFRALTAAAVLAMLWILYQWRIQHLRREEKQLRDVVNAVPANVWSASPDGAVDFVSRRWQELTGLHPENEGGWNWHAAIHPDDRAAFLADWRSSIESGIEMEREVRMRQADGEYRWWFIRKVPVFDKVGKIVKWYGSSVDVDDRKRAEELLRQTQADLAHINRMSMMGELTASLAHEIKQPIAAGVSNAEACVLWLARDQPDLGEVREAAREMVKESRRAADIIDRLRSFYKKGAPPERELVDVNEVVREMLGLLRSEANRYSIPMRADLAAELPRVMADRVQLQQVFMNLMLNGIEAMKDTGGELTIKSERIEDDQLRISISDTGVGLPCEQVDNIFDAFVTTKPQGTGMGLKITRSIVEAHGGRLWATANTGRGATFYFTLPDEATASSNSAG